MLQNCELKILIGTDHAGFLRHKEFRKGNLNEPVAVSLPLVECLWVVVTLNSKQLKVSNSKKCNNFMLKYNSECFRYKLNIFGKLIPMEPKTQQNKTYCRHHKRRPYKS